MAPKKTPIFRTQVSLPRQLHQDLKRALIKRAASAAERGCQIETSFSSWVREQAIATIAEHKK